MMGERLTGEVNHSPVNYASYLLLRLFSQGIEVTGKENIPETGPAIIVMNHMGIMEVLVPYWLLRELPTVFTKVENTRIPVVGGFLLNKLGAIPVNRGAIDRKAINATVSALGENRIIFMCPEGTRGTGDERIKLKQAKSGAAVIAQLAAKKNGVDVKISPWSVWGTEGVLPEIDKGKFLLRINEVHINIAPPYLIHASKRENPDDVMRKIMEKMRDMLPERYHGYYAR